MNLINTMRKQHTDFTSGFLQTSRSYGCPALDAHLPLLDCVGTSPLIMSMSGKPKSHGREDDRDLSHSMYKCTCFISPSLQWP